jgi:hypothetical protein
MFNMKNLLKQLELTEKDNLITAFAKGGLKGYLGFTAVAVPVFSTMLFIGKCVADKDELKKFEQENGAE